MANRRLSRSIVLQTLFEWDSGEMTMDAAALTARLKEHAQEFGANDNDVIFMQGILNTVLAKRTDIDAVIEKAAPEWPLDKIAVIDRNVLRVGLAELLYADRAQVPAKVAINEAIELAKTFGSESSGKFVNGVLGAVYIELGEPGKDEMGKSQASKKPNAGAKEVAHKDIPVQHLAGAVVYAEHEGSTYLAFVHDIFGHWTISKGKIEEGENVEEGAMREIKEELGLDVIIQDELGVNEYVANDPSSEVGKRRKRVTYFLAKAPFADLVLGSSGGLDDAQWFPLSQAGNLNFYEDTLQIITKAVNVLAKK
jgi:N utilization substance protein B